MVAWPAGSAEDDVPLAAEACDARSAGGDFRLSGIGLLLSSPFIALMPLIGWLPGIFIIVFIAEVLLFLNTGPLNAALVGCVPVQMRGTAFAVNILCIHAFGDALSNLLLGVILSLIHI